MLGAESGENIPIGSLSRYGMLVPSGMVFWPSRLVVGHVSKTELMLSASFPIPKVYQNVS